MRATLSFKLPEEQEEFDCARLGNNYKYIIDEVFSYLRKLRKYESKEVVSIEELEEFMRDLLIDD